MIWGYNFTIRWWVTDCGEHSLTIFLCSFTASLPSLCFIFFHSSLFWDKCFFCKRIHSLVFFFLGPYPQVWSMLLCNSAIIPKHFSLKRCPHSCPLMIFPDFLVNRWAFSFWILLFSFSDFSFKSWSFLILWLIAWRSVGFKGSSPESHSGIAACNELAYSWQVVSQCSLMYLSTSALLVLVGGWPTPPLYFMTGP